MAHPVLHAPNWLPGLQLLVPGPAGGTGGGQLRQLVQNGGLIQCFDSSSTGVCERSSGDTEQCFNGSSTGLQAPRGEGMKQGTTSHHGRTTGAWGARVAPRRPSRANCAPTRCANWGCPAGQAGSRARRQSARAPCSPPGPPQWPTGAPPAGLGAPEHNGPETGHADQTNLKHIQ